MIELELERSRDIRLQILFCLLGVVSTPKSMQVKPQGEAKRQEFVSCKHLLGIFFRARFYRAFRQ